VHHMVKMSTQATSKSTQKSLKTYKMENSTFNLTDINKSPTIRPEESSTEVNKSIDKTISFIKKYLGYAEDDFFTYIHLLESLPFWTLFNHIENNNRHIRN